MRTFHEHEAKHELHGITVVVETTDGGELWVGRCDDIVDAGVILRDADVHREGASSTPRGEWLEKARRFGVWPNHRRAVVPAGRVAAIRRLAEE